MGILGRSVCGVRCVLGATLSRSESFSPLLRDRTTPNVAFDSPYSDRDFHKGATMGRTAGRNSDGLRRPS
jgi:hypothetical protein